MYAIQWIIIYVYGVNETEGCAADDTLSLVLLLMLLIAF